LTPCLPLVSLVSLPLVSLFPLVQAHAVLAHSSLSCLFLSCLFCLPPSLPLSLPPCLPPCLQDSMERVWLSCCGRERQGEAGRGSERLHPTLASKIRNKDKRERGQERKRTRAKDKAQESHTKSRERATQSVSRERARQSTGEIHTSPYTPLSHTAHTKPREGDKGNTMGLEARGEKFQRHAHIPSTHPHI
jgi:hypothetical protein